MSELFEYELGLEGRTFLADALDGVAGLAGRLRDELAEGRPFALLPPNLPPDRVRRFAEGGVTSAALGARHIGRRLAGLEADGVLLLQDPWLGPDEVAALDEEAFVLDGGVCHGVPLLADGGARVAPLLAAGTSFLQVLIALPGVRLGDLRAGRADPTALARQAPLMFVSAYDQESFVGWER